MKLPMFKSVRAKLATAADVSAALAENDVLLATARAELATLEGERTDVLLHADDATVDGHERRAADLRRTLARLEARASALQVQLADATALEANAALTAARAAAEARADAAERWLRVRYGDLARGLVEGLAELKAAEKEARRVNARLAEAGRGDEAVPHIERRVHGRETIGPIGLNTILMAVPELNAPGHNSVPGYASNPWVVAD